MMELLSSAIIDFLMIHTGRCGCMRPMIQWQMQAFCTAFRRWIFLNIIFLSQRNCAVLPLLFKQLGSITRSV